MNEINLTQLKLKTFTEQDASDYCGINNINTDNITELNLSHNELIDISGIKIFKNLESLWLYENNLTDISVLKDLNKLQYLYLSYNNLKDISIVKYLKNLEILSINYNEITDISVLKYLKNLKLLNINNLEFDSDQIEYVKSINNLKELYCKNGFKDMKVIKQLKNITVYK